MYGRRCTKTSELSAAGVLSHLIFTAASGADTLLCTVHRRQQAPGSEWQGQAAWEGSLPRYPLLRNAARWSSVRASDTVTAWRLWQLGDWPISFLPGWA